MTQQTTPPQPYPPYPVQPNYPTYPVQPTSPAAANAPAPKGLARPSRFGLIFGIVATIVTLGAIVLAVFAPQLTQMSSIQIPQGWQQVYDSNPADNAGAWESASGCSFPGEGLHIAHDSSCKFTPASNTSLSGGVLIVARLAPAAQIPVSEDAGILLDDSVLVFVAQDGTYEICLSTCDALTGSGVLGSTIAWHADAFNANEMAVLYNPDQGTVSFYANGQFVTQVETGISQSPSIALTTSASGEALFSHVTIYAGSVS
jgi:hypothetical protein